MHIDGMTYDFRIRDNDVLDAFTGESLLSETTLDVVEYFGMGWVRFVKNVLECKIRGAKAVAEMLSENPSAILMVTRLSKRRRSRDQSLTSICSLLHGMASRRGTRIAHKEWVVGQAV